MYSDKNTAIATFSQMRELATLENYVSLEQRIKFLKSLRQAVLDNKQALQIAIKEDFDARSIHETMMADIIPSIASIDYLLKHLKKWLRGEKRPTQIQFWPAKNKIEFHPKGVVLIISPWNYPVSLSIPPMASALAAGNRIILKPSECTPKTSQILANLVKSALPADRVQVLRGGAKLSAQLTALDFDHIVFTGSTRVGRLVMQNAAKNLTPVTLELGGKSPAIINEDYDLEIAAHRLARGKLFNAGQTCIAPDYVMVPSNKIAEFITLFEKSVTSLYPKIANNSDYSSIVNQAHFERLNSLLDDAKEKGARVISIGSHNLRSSGNRKLHPHLILDVSKNMQIANEEIFGPILSIIPYDNLEEASQYINLRPHPLALYYFDNDKARTKNFLNKTISGGAVVNDTILQFVQDDLPFGGVGNSGTGSCHGYEGFKELSHAKSVFYQSKFNAGNMIYPPYGKLVERIIGFLVR